MEGIKRILYWATPALLLTTLPAHAHPWHGGTDGLTGGLLHPLLGIDHLLAMVAVGVATLTYVTGFTLSTALLHGFGLMTGHLLQRHTLDTVMRAGGLGLASVGVLLLVGA